VRRSLLGLLGLFGVIVLVLVPAAAASAHVSIEPPSAPKGSDAVLGFVVPNEKDTATTTKVQITFPADHPILDAKTEALPGWTSTVQTAHLAKPVQTADGTFSDYVSSITWSGGQIGKGNFAEFRVAVGLPDDASSLTFKVLQTYSDASIVRWIETSAPGGEAPENPAPVLTLTNGAAATATPTTAAAAAVSTVSSNDVDTAKTLGIVGIILGVLALLVAVSFGIRARIRPARPTSQS
jgi:uncharacterized protein YcnI